MHLVASFAGFTMNCVTIELFCIQKKKSKLNWVNKAWTINLCLQLLYAILQRTFFMCVYLVVQFGFVFNLAVW